MLLDKLRHPLINHSGSPIWVCKPFNKRLVVFASLWTKRPANRFRQRKFLDPLGCKIRIKFSAGNAPQLLAIPLEKNLKEASAKSAHTPTFKRAVVLDWLDLFFEVAADTACGLQDPQLCEY